MAKKKTTKKKKSSSESNKLMQKFSKSAAGMAVDTVSDFVDILSQMVTEFLNQKYKLKQKVEDVKNATIKTLYHIKKEFLKSIVEAFLLISGLATLLIGGIIFLSRFIPLEFILLSYGVVVTIWVLLKVKVDV